jgi:hypothetical protein
MSFVSELLWEKKGCATAFRSAPFVTLLWSRESLLILLWGRHKGAHFRTFTAAEHLCHKITTAPCICASECTFARLCAGTHFFSLRCTITMTDCAFALRPPLLCARSTFARFCVGSHFFRSNAQLPYQTAVPRTMTTNNTRVHTTTITRTEKSSLFEKFDGRYYRKSSVFPSRWGYPRLPDSHRNVPRLSLFFFDPLFLVIPPSWFFRLPDLPCFWHQDSPGTFRTGRHVPRAPPSLTVTE